MSRRSYLGWKTNSEQDFQIHLCLCLTCQERRLAFHLYSVKNKIIHPPCTSSLHSKVPFDPLKASTKCWFPKVCLVPGGPISDGTAQLDLKPARSSQWAWELQVQLILTTRHRGSKNPCLLTKYPSLEETHNDHMVLWCVFHQHFGPWTTWRERHREQPTRVTRTKKDRFRRPLSQSPNFTLFDKDCPEKHCPCMRKHKPCSAKGWNKPSWASSSPGSKLGTTSLFNTLQPQNQQGWKSPARSPSPSIPQHCQGHH